MSDMDVNEQDEIWDDWEEEENENNVKCLFCSSMFATIEKTLDHCLFEHEFDFNSNARKMELDIMGSIRFVNFIREISSQETCPTLAVQRIMSILDLKRCDAFQDEKFMKPIIDCDQFICLLWDEDEDENEEGLNESKRHVLVESEKQEEVEILRAKVNRYADIIRNLTEEDHELELEHQQRQNPVVRDNDTYYFDSYSHVGIHREMILDKVRTDSYRDAILKNRHLFEGKVVLDVGCGTGILSMFIAQAGAAKVIGIDCSNMLDQAREIVVANKLDDKILLIKGKVENVELPVQHVDVIVSEWMGYCLLYESMLDTVIFARDKWLVPGGHVFPDVATLHIEAIQDLQNRVGFWNDVYGFDMSSVKKAVPLKEAFIEIVSPEASLSNRCLFKEINIESIRFEQLNFTAPFYLTMTKQSICHGLLVSFDIFFSRGCTSPVEFSTGSHAEPTHWQQVFFHWNQSQVVQVGDVVSGSITLARNGINHREIDVLMEWELHGQKFCQSYTVN